MARNTNPNNTITDEKYQLTKKQSDFAIYYVELGNQTQAAIKAGYAERNAKAQSYRLLTNPGIKRKIHDLMHDETKLKIATSMEVMDFFTRVMNGEVKDQFNLDPSLSDRIKAAVELAKRTTDIDIKSSGKADNEIRIKLVGFDEDLPEENESNGQKEEKEDQT